MEGIVIKSTGSHYLVRNAEGAIMECRLKGQFKMKGIRSTNPIAVGDQVVFAQTQDRVGLINEIQERRNYIIRKATNLSKSTHIIAANIDVAYLIITLHQPRTSTGFIDRFLVTAEAYHIPVCLLMNKKDLLTSTDLTEARELLSMYEGLGYPGHLISTFDSVDMQQLAGLLAGKVNLFAGHSGVGKSSIINALCPELRIKVEQISSVHLKGTHTTTFAEMHPLPEGGYIIDTPGIKEFGLTAFQKEEVGLYFPEMKALLSNCQFYNCTHRHEPKCAVKNAVENNEISRSRYQNYVSILQDEYFNEKEWD